MELLVPSFEAVLSRRWRIRCPEKLRQSRSRRAQCGARPATRPTGRCRSGRGTTSEVDGPAGQPPPHMVQNQFPWMDELWGDGRMNWISPPRRPGSGRPRRVESFRPSGFYGGLESHAQSGPATSVSKPEGARGPGRRRWRRRSGMHATFQRRLGPALPLSAPCRRRRSGLMNGICL